MQYAGALLLSSDQISKLISLDEIVQIVESTFKAHGNNQVVMPAKLALDISLLGPDSWLNAMPAYVHPGSAAGIKWAGGFRNNPAKGLGYVQAMLILNDPETGLPLAIMDATWITSARTGAVPAVTARHLANPGPLAVALVGAGTQARWALRSFKATASVAEVRVFDIRPEAAAAFAHEMQAELEVPVRVAAGIEAAVRGAGVIVTATTADAPLVKQEWVSRGALVVSMGSYQEIDEALVFAADKLVVDHLGQNLHRGEFKKLFEAGRLKESDIAAEFGEIVAGVKPGRTRPDEIIIAGMIGVASTDIAVARVVYERALSQGKSQSFRFS